MKPQYQWSDAWILLAIIYAGKEEAATLSEVVGAADYIQHAIVTFQELEGALARLTKNQLIIDNDGRYSPSGKIITFYKSTTKPRRPVLKEQGDVQRFIGASSWSPTSSPQDANRGASYPPLTLALYEKAVQGYLSRMKKRK